jgi:hypothetical protein
MKHLLLTACLLMLSLSGVTAAAYEPTQPPARASSVSFAGGDGTTIEKAVVILGATEATGVEAEYQWLASHYPGWKGVDQSLVNGDKKVYDVMNFTLPDGSKHTVFFDITDYFGKY